MPRILGIDPGIRHTGYGVVDASGARFAWLAGGVIRPPVDAQLAERLLHIATAVEAVIAEHRPDCCAVENIFTHRNPQSTLTLGRAQSAAILAAARHGIDVVLYSPSEVKQSLTGGGRADKQQVRFMVERILGLDLSAQSDDLSDALAVAICHGGREGSLLARGAKA